MNEGLSSGCLPALRRLGCEQQHQKSKEPEFIKSFHSN